MAKGVVLVACAAAALAGAGWPGRALAEGSPLLGWRIGVEAGLASTRATLDAGPRLDLGLAGADAALARAGGRIDEAAAGVEALRAGVARGIVPAAALAAPEAALGAARAEAAGLAAFRDLLAAHPRSSSGTAEGFHGRLAAGWAGRISGRLVLGAEVDANLHPHRISIATAPVVPGGDPTRLSVRGNASFGGNLRVGWLVRPDLMPWVSAGGEVLLGSASSAGAGIDISRSVPGYRFGGGVDWAPFPGRPWFARAAYEHARHPAFDGLSGERHSVRVGVFRTF